ncbi:MAG: hypothetical protein IIY70_01290, partial [Oscillospiraceae bacterium]|nr:hypothetical protein [Oscillospiraceae bacterium]
MKRLYIFFLSFVLLFSVSLPVYAELATSGSEGHYFVMDHAELLSQREAKQLEQQASKISQ